MVHELARRDERVAFVGSDLGHGTLAAMGKEFPGRFFMEGIAEAAVVGLAAGLAQEGFVPYVNTIATFLARRAYDQIVIDVCEHDLPVRLIGNGGGLVYAPLGSTHLAFEDLAILQPVPHMAIVAPADAEEMRDFMPQTLDWPGPIYIRLAKGYDPVVTGGLPPFVLGKGRLARPGRDVLVLTTGVTLGPALDAAKVLAGRGVDAAVLHLPTVKPLDVEAILAHAGPVRAVLTVEEHLLTGGLGSTVAALLAEADMLAGRRFRRLGLPDRFPDDYGTQAELMARAGLSGPGISSAVAGLLGMNP
jgi:transketolase